MSALPSHLVEAARRFVTDAAGRGLSVATAESCTGGLVAALLTEIAGSSAVVECGFVTYSNGAKTSMLAVPDDLIEAHGAVSKDVACVMARGALLKSAASISVAITGIAGPGGGTDAKPVGLVHFACARRDGNLVHVERRFGDLGRETVRLEAVAVALQLLAQVVETQASDGPPRP